jgi:predicted phage terminase large subunit-like protein
MAKRIADSYQTRTRTSQNSGKGVIKQETKIKALFDFWAFVDMIGFHGGSKNFGECHDELVKWAFARERKRRQLIMMPRGHLKSTLMSVARTLWRIYQNPNIRIFVGTESHRLSTSFIREVKMYLEDFDLQEKLWNNRPHKSGRLVPVMDSPGSQKRNQVSDTDAKDKKVVWRNDAIQVIRDDILKEPTLVSGSVGSIATGFHYDELIFDDVVTFDNINTEAKRERLFQWIYDMESVIDPLEFDEDLFECYKQVDGSRVRQGKFAPWCWVGDTVTVVGTRYDAEDYYGHVLENNETLGFDCYQRNIYKNGTDNTDGYIWAERMNSSIESRLRASMNDRRFASQYLNSIIADSEQSLSWEQINFINPQCIVCNRANIAAISRGPEETKEIRLRVAIDPAATSNTSSDYTCIVVGGVDDQNNFYVVDMYLGKEPFNTWLQKMYQLLDKWRLSAVTIESVGFQKQLIESIRDRFSTNRPIQVREYGASQEHKQDRIEATLQPLFSSGKCFMNQNISKIPGLRDQFNLFGRPSVKDDAPDAMAMLKEISTPLAKQVQPFNPRKQMLNSRYGGYI